ncbi:MAG: serine/threonine protein kinase, partial [Acidobacteria bacterium]|nr:serine/threonine protein kinase [Acidobacteriota bacterium]
MTPERWQRIDEIFNLVVEMDATERSACLDRVCATDTELRRDVEALIETDAASPRDTDWLAMVAAEWAKDQKTSFSSSRNEGRKEGLKEGQKRGKTLGHFQIKSLLGVGGMGEVYLAEDTKLWRKVALKLLNAESTGDPQRVQRFKQEARAASALNHPNIVTIFEIDEIEGDCFIATEFIEGETLRQRMNRASLMLGETLAIVQQIASALREAHGAGIVHRDIKPENIMVRPDGLVKVLDFGLAKLNKRKSGERKVSASDEVVTSPGIVMGTVAYMSPEQLCGLDVDERSDVFSLGVMFYEMVAGRRPFAGQTDSELMAEILRDTPPPISQFLPSVPPMLESVIIRALQKDPNDRYQSISQFFDDFSALKKQLETSPTIPNQALPEIKTTLLGKLKANKLAAGMALTLLLAVSALIYFQTNKRRTED